MHLVCLLPSSDQKCSVPLRWSGSNDACSSQSSDEIRSSSRSKINARASSVSNRLLINASKVLGVPMASCISSSFSACSGGSSITTLLKSFGVFTFYKVL